MVEMERGQSNMPKGKKPTDPINLTPAQKAALAIAKAQGKDTSLSLADIEGKMDSEAVEDLMESIMEMRKKASKSRVL